MPDIDWSSYLPRLAQVESSNNPNAKAKTSSASGLYQFIRSTGRQYGLPWGGSSSQPFGGATVTVEQQNAAVRALTTDNASLLSRAGVAINNATLYAAHFLGAGTAVNVFTKDGSTLVSQHVGPGVITANPFLRGMTVDGFTAWLERKMGVSVSSAGGSGSGPLAPVSPPLKGPPAQSASPSTGSVTGSATPYLEPPGPLATRQELVAWLNSLRVYFLSIPPFE